MVVSILDWRDLAPEASPHACDCEYCDLQGEDEREWPLLAEVEDSYVSDRYICVRRDRAPVPTDYEGPVVAAPSTKVDTWSTALTSEPPPSDMHFRWSVIKAVEVTGWRLRLLRDEERIVGVIDESGQFVGWAVVGHAVRGSSLSRSARYSEAVR